MSEVKKPQPQHEAALIPIVIGVTGHRDLREEDRDHLREAVNRIFKEIKELYPSTPLVLLTPLAEGADRLVAKAALDFGAKLVAPLPMPPEKYRQDFKSERSLSEFDDLLSKVQDYFVLPNISGTAKNAHVSTDRVESYILTGAYIVSHSQILIALWDGAESNLMGGTAHTVRCKLEGISEKYRRAHGFLDCVDQGPVYHIITPRISNPLPEDTAFTLKKYFPQGWENDASAADFYHQLLARIDSFNRDLINLFPKLIDQIRTS